MTYFDFNSASEQTSFDLIPKGTLVRVRMTIRPGGFDDASQGWTGGYATRNDNTGSVYLNCEFVVMDGEFARRKMWSLIGLHSPKGPEWANMGRTFVKAILNSARGVHPGDNSPAAQNARRISGFADLDGIEFVARALGHFEERHASITLLLVELARCHTALGDLDAAHTHLGVALRHASVEGAHSTRLAVRGALAERR